MFRIPGSRAKPKSLPAINPVYPSGRLTLQSATPVMTASQSAQTTLFYTPYQGNWIPIYNGSYFVQVQFAELSIATTDTIRNPAAIGASKVNDWYVWQDAGGLHLSHGVDWTSDTARNTNNTMVNGILLNTSGIANGPAALRGTYVGTTRSNGTSTLDYIFGSAASGGSAGFLGVWNVYNRVLTQNAVTDSGANYTYTSATIRQARASAGNQVSFVIGLAEDAILVSYTARITTTAAVGAIGRFGYGIDSTSEIALQGGIVDAPTAASFVSGNSNVTTSPPRLGFHTFAATEQSDGTNANTFNTSSLNVFIVVIRN